MGEAAKDRTVLRITGEDRVEFLQGLVTNDVKRLAQGAVYAALLTPQGKFIADFFLIAQGDAILLDCDSTAAPALKQRLMMYKLRAKVTLEETDLKVQRGLGTAPEGAVMDPRHEGLGWRHYSDTEGSAAEIDWDALRVQLEVPQSGAELDGESYILEMGFERLHGVDFRKGCYVGQEVTARMKHKTELRKGLRRVEVEGAATAGTDILTADGKPAGKLHTVAGSIGLAYLRFDRIGPGMTAGDAQITVPE